MKLAMILILAGCSAAQQCGDCNGDGWVGTIDALAAAQIAAGIPVAMVWDGTAAPPRACDVSDPRPLSDDPLVDVMDALLIAQASVGIPVVLACL